MKAPLKVLIGWVVIVIVLVVVVFYRYNLIDGIKKSMNQPSPTTTETSAPPSAQETQQASSNKDPVLPQQEASTDTSKAATPQSLAAGKKLFEEKTCVLCHGADGKADTPTGQAMKATNLTLGTFQHNTDKLESTAYILKVIENGVPGTAMVSFKAQIPNEKDRKDLAAYVHSLAKK